MTINFKCISFSLMQIIYQMQNCVMLPALHDYCTSVPHDQKTLLVGLFFSVKFILSCFANFLRGKYFSKISQRKCTEKSKQSFD